MAKCGACWLFKLVYIAFLLCFFAVFIFWLIFRPKEVKFHVTDATLTQFNFNTTNNTLYYNLSANIILRNSNKRVGVNYNSIEAFAYYQNKLFSNVGLTPFYQGHKNTSILRPVFEGQKDMSLQVLDLSKMDEEKSAGIFGIDIRLSVQISINYVHRLDQLSKERKAEFQNLHLVKLRQQQAMHTKWEPPDLGAFKVNYDGAIFTGTGRAGIGVVIRNSEGAVMASLSQQITQPATVAQVEAFAARRAVEFALEIGITSAVFEGDSDTISKELNNPEQSLALHGHLIEDVKVLTSFFNNISFVHVRRQGNRVAHALARWATNSPSLSIWMEDVPPDISCVVQADLAVTT